MKTLLRLCIFLFVSSFGFLKAEQGEQIRICVWNLRNYGPNETEERNASIRTVLEEIRPDAFAVQRFRYKERASLQFTEEVTNKIASDIIYEEVPVTYIDSLNNPYFSKLYYNSSKLTLLNSVSLQYGFPHQDFFVRFLINSDLQPKDTLIVCVASFSPTSEENRLGGGKEIGSVMFGTTYHEYNWDKSVLIGGLYFNSPNEIGYKYITMGTRVVDPLGREWTRDSVNFVNMYSNSTRFATQGCDTVQGIGLRDRHDYIFHKISINEENYIPNSYTVFGNDGLDRRRSSITNPPNQKVSQEIAEALQCASSHLPVYADYVFGKATSVESSTPSELSFNLYPNPLKESSTISCSLPADGPLKITLHDMLGREVAVVHDAFKSAGSYTFPFKNENLPDGMYFLKMVSGGRSLTRSVRIVQ